MSLRLKGPSSTFRIGSAALSGAPSRALGPLGSMQVTPDSDGGTTVKLIYITSFASARIDTTIKEDLISHVALSADICRSRISVVSVDDLPLESLPFWGAPLGGAAATVRNLARDGVLVTVSIDACKRDLDETCGVGFGTGDMGECKTGLECQCAAAASYDGAYRRRGVASQYGAYAHAPSVYATSACATAFSPGPHTTCVKVDHCLTNKVLTDDEVRTVMNGAANPLGPGKTASGKATVFGTVGAGGAVTLDDGNGNVLLRFPFPQSTGRFPAGAPSDACEALAVQVASALKVCGDRASASCTSANRGVAVVTIATPKRKSGETCQHVFGAGYVGECEDGLTCRCVGECADPYNFGAPRTCSGPAPAYKPEVPPPAYEPEPAPVPPPYVAPVPEPVYPAPEPAPTYPAPPSNQQCSCYGKAKRVQVSSPTLCRDHCTDYGGCCKWRSKKQRCQRFAKGTGYCVD